MPSPLLFFVNPRSGGGMGAKLISRIQNLESVYIVKLPDEAETWVNMDKTILENPALRVVICGGDGSVSWIVTLLMNYYGKTRTQGVNRPPAAIIPLGTGNDMSRTLNWGPYFTSTELRKIEKKLEKIRFAISIKIHDVWRVTETPIDNSSEPIVHTMTNYCSFGTDAKIAKDFEDFRTDNPGCFCCRCMSKTIYGPMSFKSICGQPNMKDYATAKWSYGDQNYDIVPKNDTKVLSLQQIPSMYAGMDNWHWDIPRSVDDGKFELTEMTGFSSLAKIQLGMHPTKRIGQADHFELTSTDKMYYQVDGEGYCAEKPSKFSVDKFGTYPLLYNV